MFNNKKNFFYSRQLSLKFLTNKFVLLQKKKKVTIKKKFNILIYYAKNVINVLYKICYNCIFSKENKK